MDRVENAALTIAGLLMLVFFAALVYSATGLNISIPTCVTGVAPFKKGKIIDKGNNHYEVHVVAKMWAFDPPEVRLPPGADVDLYLSALDVTHGLYIEHTNVNLMAVPGSVNAARIHFDREGEYGMICHEYCGLGHQNMMGRIVIAKGTKVPMPEEVRLHELMEGRAGHEILESAGRELFESKGCTGCHSIDGSAGVGPTMKGLFGRETELTDGQTMKANEAYVEESIRHPNAQIVKGFQPVMPEVPLTDAEVKDLMAYIKTLS
jgi:cytochrome c oxidase subunit II